MIAIVAKRIWGFLSSLLAPFAPAMLIALGLAFYVSKGIYTENLELKEEATHLEKVIGSQKDEIAVLEAQNASERDVAGEVTTGLQGNASDACERRIELERQRHTSTIKVDPEEALINQELPDEILDILLHNRPE